MMRIAVLGATGAQGRHVTEAALTTGARIKSLARAETKSALADLDIDVVEGDLADRDTVAQVLNSAEVAIYTPPLVFDEDQALTWLDFILAEAEAQGVRRVVLNSSIRPPLARTGIAAIDIKIAMEDRLSKSQLETVRTRPTLYLGNLLIPVIAAGLLGEGRTLAYPLRADVACRWISWEDAGRAAAAAATADGVVGRALDVGGAQLLTGPGLAGILGETLGAPVSYYPLPEDAFEAGLEGVLGSATARNIADLYRWLNTDGREHLDIDGTGMRTLGIEPEQTKTWAGRQRWAELAAKSTV